jgi:hypothetical protein
VIKQGCSKEYKLSVDASDVGVGAVLLQEGKDNFIANVLSKVG